MGWPDEYVGSTQHRHLKVDADRLMSAAKGQFVLKLTNLPKYNPIG